VRAFAVPLRADWALRASALRVAPRLIDFEARRATLGFRAAGWRRFANRRLGPTGAGFRSRLECRLAMVFVLWEP
jgi:hypothetical protein